MTPIRTCGACTLCCAIFSVPEIAKPVWELCRHCTEAGCATHDTRPPSCRNFECFWLMDPSFPEDMRPDRCGVVVSWNEDHDSVVLHLDPDRPDALAESPGADWLGALLPVYDPVFVVCGEDKMMIRRPG
jgi:hypothetical protein